jgi:ribosome-binding factor A
MAKYRRGRINDAVAEELAIAITEVREPKVVNNFISITRADVAPDLRFATVYFSCIGDSDEAAEGLKKCTGMFRHHLAVTLNLRITPDLRFVKDGSIEHGAKIARFLEEIKASDKAREEAKSEENAENGEND